jgi:hypothetical protein
MKGKLAMSAVALCAMGALALAPAGFGAGTKTVAKVKCTAKFTNLTPHQLKGEAVGLTKCGAPFGAGIQWTQYTETLSATGAVTAKGPTKAWSDLGSVHGTYKLAGKLVGMVANLKGTSTITGGTGAYKGARGSGTLACTTKDTGVTYSCTFTLRFTKL